MDPQRHSALDPTARAWLDIDLQALRANARAFSRLVRAPVLAVVKANAYGLGVGPVVQALEGAEPWGYGVGALEEGEELRALAITRPILVLTPLLPDQVARCRDAGLRPTIGDLETLDAWLAGPPPAAPFHLEIDTGMRRAGFPWNDADLVDRLRTTLAEASGWEGVFCHFHSAETDREATRLQWARLQETLRALGRRPPLVHAANSGAGVMDLGLGADLARPGLYLYGGRLGGHRPAQVVSFHARIVAVRQVAPNDTVSYGATWQARHPTTIATIAAGYADGVPMALSNGGQVEVAGTLLPIAGRVTMDMTMLDVGDRRVVPGDIATVFGGQLDFVDQAEAAGTIPYLMLTSIGSRVGRRYGGAE